MVAFSLNCEFTKWWKHYKSLRLCLSLVQHSGSKGKERDSHAVHMYALEFHLRSGGGHGVTYYPQFSSQRINFFFPLQFPT